MSNPETILKLDNIGKEFATQNGPLHILDKVSVNIYRGEKVAIIGPSGSGKSTLLSLIGLLDSPTSGTVNISGVEVSTLNESEQAKFRNKHIGFAFQSFELISPFTVMENITAPLEIGGKKIQEKEVLTLISSLGLTERQNSMTQTLSGGEKQRVAIARALINKPTLLLADEPTGSLDRETGERVLSLLLDSVEKTDTTLIVITHDESISERMDRVFELKDKTLHERI